MCKGKFNLDTFIVTIVISEKPNMFRKLDWLSEQYGYQYGTDTHRRMHVNWKLVDKGMKFMASFGYFLVLWESILWSKEYHVKQILALFNNSNLEWHYVTYSIHHFQTNFPTKKHTIFEFKNSYNDNGADSKNTIRMLFIDDFIQFSRISIHILIWLHSDISFTDIFS